MTKRYGNKTGHSGVLSYETGEEAIAVEFVDGTLYLYTWKSAGKKAVETMKKLARKGKGLSTFISQHVKERYAAKIESKSG